MENINCSEHNGTESHVSNIFLFAMETRRHFAIYQQVCCQIRVEGLLRTLCACPGMVQLSLMHGRNSCVFPTVPLELQRLAAYRAMCFVATFPRGQLKVFCFHHGNDEHVLAVWRSSLSDTLWYVKGTGLDIERDLHRLATRVGYDYFRLLKTISCFVLHFASCASCQFLMSLPRNSF